MGVAEDPRQLNVHLASLYSIRCNLHKMDCKVVFVQICMYACVQVCTYVAFLYVCARVSMSVFVSHKPYKPLNPSP